MAISWYNLSTVRLNLNISSSINADPAIIIILANSTLTPKTVLALCLTTSTVRLITPSLWMSYWRLLLCIYFTFANDRASNTSFQTNLQPASRSKITKPMQRASLPVKLSVTTLLHLTKSSLVFINSSISNLRESGMAGHIHLIYCLPKDSLLYIIGSNLALLVKFCP